MPDVMEAQKCYDKGFAEEWRERTGIRYRGAAGNVELDLPTWRTMAEDAIHKAGRELACGVVTALERAC